jgi:hypothetical protein
MRIGIVLGLLLAVSACGSHGGGDGVATAGHAKARASASATVGEQQKALLFARCMRQHGVDMPDPTFSGGGVSIAIRGGVDPNKVKAATAQCKRYLPDGGQSQKANPKMLERARKLAACMRAHGIRKFPDPDANGGISIKAGPDLDPRSPAFQAADKACAKFHGAGGTVQVGTGR